VGRISHALLRRKYIGRHLETMTISKTKSWSKKGKGVILTPRNQFNKVILKPGKSILQDLEL
jgi:hypothetical protein